ncbi:MAG: hypothetical protein AAGI53_13830 [Planctomycetota bacterium]
MARRGWLCIAAGSTGVLVAGCSTPPVTEPTEPIVTPLERSGSSAESESAAMPAPAIPESEGEAVVASPPEDDTPLASPEDGRPELDLDPGVPDWFAENVREADGKLFASASFVGPELRATRRAALLAARSQLAEIVGDEAAAAARAERGGVYPVEEGFRVFVLLSVLAPGEGVGEG